MPTVPDIIRLSPNFNNAPVRGRTVIIHATRSGRSMNPTEFVGTLNYMATRGTTSSQWVISRQGVKARVVSDALQAHHAQEDNARCWGIELEQGAEQDGFTEPQMNALIEVCRSYMRLYDVPAVRARSSTEPGFIGHQDTAQGRRNGKSDPGRYFNWEHFLARLSFAPTPQEDTFMMKWVTWRDRPDHVMFRSYLVWTAPDGLKSRFVPDIHEHNALEETGIAGPLQWVSLETLRQFKCNPDPAS